MECTDQSISVCIKLEKGDISHISSAISNTSSLYKIIRIFIWIVIIFNVSLLTNVYHNNPVENPFLSYFPTIFLCTILLSVNIIVPLILKINTINQYEINNPLKQHIRYTFNNNGVKVNNGFGDYSFLWIGISKVCETNRTFIIYQPNLTFFIIPKRFFLLENNITKVQSIIQNNLPKGKYSRIRK